MKRINLILSCVLALTLVACTSKEEKANKLIKQYMYENLYDFESYEPMKTSVDTLFVNDIHFDKAAYAYAVVGKNSLNKSNEYLREVKSASTSMDIWSDSYTSYGRSQWNEANEKMKENLDKAKQSLAEVYRAMIGIKEREEILVQVPADEQTGWKVDHRFRCKTKGGSSTIGDYCFIFDKDIKEILDVYDVDEDEYKSYIGFLDEALSYDKADLEINLKNYEPEEIVVAE